MRASALGTFVRHWAFVAAIFAASACGGTTAHQARRSSSPEPTACTAKDLVGAPEPVPAYRKLRERITTWGGHVHLDPPPDGAQPTVSLAHAWDNGFEDLHVPTAVVGVDLAEWTSDYSMTAEAPDGRTVSHRHVLAWVAMAKRIPVSLQEIESPVACVFGISITAVSATTGQVIADSTYAGRAGGEGQLLRPAAETK